MDKTSIIIPARNEKYLQNTIDDILINAIDEIEIIVVLDGYWPDTVIKPSEKVSIIHMGKVKGMRYNENAAARIATGKYLMKCDAHCMFNKGFDEILKADCEKNMIVVPSRYSMDVKKWEKTRGPVDYLYLTYPWNNDDVYGPGFHGRKWRGPTGMNGSFWHLEDERKKILIDDIIVFQGSCWFMEKNHFFNIDGLNIDTLYQEALELSFKTWLSGGRVVRNKKTWYAHYHKNKADGGRGFWLSKKQKDDSTIFNADYWMHNKWPKQTRKFEWLIEKFWPLEDWPEDWNNPEHFKNWVNPWEERNEKKGSGQGDTEKIQNETRGHPAADGLAETFEPGRPIPGDERIGVF